MAVTGLRCDACGRGIGRATKHWLFYGGPDRRNGSVLCTFCSSCVFPGQGRTTKLHRLVDPTCSISWHDVWDHCSYAIPENAFQSERLRRFMLNGMEPVQEESNGALTAGELVVLGLCSGACLVADAATAESCDCRCQGEWHGALVDTEVESNAWYRPGHGRAEFARRVGADGTKTPRVRRASELGPPSRPPWSHFPHCPGCHRRIASKARYVPGPIDGCCPHCETDLKITGERP